MSYKSILIVEDDIFTSRLLKRYLESKGYIVHQAFDIGVALNKSVQYRLNAVVLDLELPSGLSLERLDELRRLGQCPIIVYTSKSKESLELQSLDLGADDFVLKDRGLDILYQRLKKLLNTNHEPKDIDDNQVLIKIGEICIDRMSQQLLYLGNVHRLSKSETLLLFYLAKNINKLVDRDELSLYIKGYLYDGWTRSFDLMIFRLRKRLSKLVGDALEIETIRGKGYRMTLTNGQ